MCACKAYLSEFNSHPSLHIMYTYYFREIDRFIKLEKHEVLSFIDKFPYNPTFIVGPLFDMLDIKVYTSSDFKNSS